MHDGSRVAPGHLALHLAGHEGLEQCAAWVGAPPVASRSTPTPFKWQAMPESMNGPTAAEPGMIEVKAARDVDDDDFRHLRWLRDRLGERFTSGVVLHLGERALPAGDRLASVPITALWSP